MLGLFDSGMGGVTVLRRLRDAFPLADLLFFADQAHAPYGERSADDLIAVMHRNLAWLDERGVNAIVMACNTSCAMANRYGWPPVSVPVLDLIDSAALAVERSGAQRIGVIATTATARSGSYARQIVRRIPTARVFEVGAPALVPLIEAGKLEGDVPANAVREVCATLPHDIEAVVLACTHYPLLDGHFAAALGPSVARIDPALVQAERTAALFETAEPTRETGRIECVTNGDRDHFERSIRALIPDLLLDIRHVDGARQRAAISNASAVPET